MKLILNQTGFEKGATYEVFPSYSVNLNHDFSNTISIFWGMFIKLTMIIGFSQVAFGVIEDKPFFAQPSQLEAPPFVVLFKKEGRELTPKCHIPVEKYPESIPHFITDSPGEFSKYSSVRMDEGVSFKVLEDFNIVEECDPEQSVQVSNQAKHFDLYPQVAIWSLFAPVVSVLSCALGFGITGMGGWKLAEEHDINFRDQRLDHWITDFVPTHAEILVGGGLFTGPALGYTQNNAYTYALERHKDLPNFINRRLRSGLTKKAKLDITDDVQRLLAKRVAKTSRLVGGWTGAFCSVAGGIVGYFVTKNLIRKDKKATALQANIDKLKDREQETAHYVEQLEGDLNSADTVAMALRQRAEGLKKQRDLAIVRLAGLGSDLDSAYQKIDHLKEQIKAKEEQLTHLQEELLSANNRIAKESAKGVQVRALKERALNLRVRLDNARLEAVRLKGALSSAENREKELQKQLLEERDRIADWEEALEEIAWP